MGALLKSKLDIIFPSNVKYGDIIKGLPVDNNSCDALYSSHVLEHLSLNDFRRALRNSFQILKPGGIMRCVMPDLEYCAKTYVAALDRGEVGASDAFFKMTLLGKTDRPRGFKGTLKNWVGNESHLRIWDHLSFRRELEAAGFINVRRCQYHDSEDPSFLDIEEEGRFINCLAMEARKPA